MATSKIKTTQLRKKVIWTNSNPSAIADQTIQTDFTETALFVVVVFRIYLSSGVSYMTSRIIPNTGSTIPELITSIRWDGSNNYIVGRNIIYRFYSNELVCTVGYRYDTYKTATIDNDVLIPLQIVAYY